ncbi:hypothetical protein GIB67_007559 [Kingdonia uniflora]|uniref:HMG box domain-containing protein n=1 Tax=Kingdonia uniflora TaxID=39325 RepID=A0A7J7LNH3_9MAGN|nr:hypothetical protein GIB67_007559 [Kingdonia uniflora]
MLGACVQNLLNSVVEALLADKNRKFIYVEMASIFSSSFNVGFDSLFFGSIDYQDRAKRKSKKSLEVVSRVSKTFGSSAQIFAGAFLENYEPPSGFYFEVNDASPVVQSQRLCSYCSILAPRKDRTKKLKALKPKTPSGNEANILAGNISQTPLPDLSGIGKENNETLISSKNTTKRNSKLKELKKSFKKELQGNFKELRLDKEKKNELVNELVKVKRENLDAEFKDVTNIVGEKWRNLSVEENKPYEEKYQVEREAYLQIVVKEK